MIIEIHGADFRNKGGELMLRTTIHEIKRRLPAAQFVVDPLIGSFAERSELGLLQYFPPRGWMGSNKFRYLFRLQKIVGGITNKLSFLRRTCRSYGCITLDKVDALIDISGFAFSSQWGYQPCLDFASLTKYYSKRNKPIIMLPQAFGPFESQLIKRGMAEIIRNSSLIFARDGTSYNYLKEINAKSLDNLRKVPDITFFYPPKKNDYDNPNFDNECLIIPNIRMLDQGAKKWKDKYIETLSHIIIHLNKNERKVAILIHDSTGKDLDIAEMIKKNIQDNLKVYNISDPLAIKQKISTAPFVVTSRYHGAIAAFSQAVPSLCMGWSHKYNELYDSFDLNSFIMSSGGDLRYLTQRLDQLASIDENKKIRQKISGFLKTAKKENETMWNEVIRELS